MLPHSLLELLLLGLIFGIRDFVNLLWLLVQQLLDLPKVFEVAIQIALFSFLGFLLYEKVLGNVEKLEARTVRKYARIYLASTFLLFFAYILAYLRGVGWVAATFGSWTLRSLEGFAGFLGFVTLLWPLYPLFRLLGGKQPISKAMLPNLDQIMYGAVLVLVYASLMFGLQVTGQRDFFGRAMQLSLLVGIFGTIGTVWLSNQRKRERWRQVLTILTMQPMLLVVLLSVIRSWI